MYQIVYLSRAAASFDDDFIEQLAGESAKRNAHRDVTGMLLYDGARFLQALEGPEDTVAAIMERIKRDPRHDKIEYISHAPVADRQFGSWSMLYKRTPDDCCTSAFLAGVKEGMTEVADPFLKAAFIGFAALSTRRSERYECSAISTNE